MKQVITLFLLIASAFLLTSFYRQERSGGQLFWWKPASAGEKGVFSHPQQKGPQLVLPASLGGGDKQEPMPVAYSLQSFL
ncbi:MAG TPA: hypothetical protein PKC69_13880 [Chitinophagaceae bacterium]|nr:hypothetical protein [Chitinophagaceae bacterium]